jgi:hypothetical protein
VRRLLAPAFAIAAIWALFLPAADPWESRFFLDFRPPAALLLVVAGLALLALARRPLSRVGRWLVASLLLAAALLQLVAAAVLVFLDRVLDLFFDIAHLPSLFGLFTDALGPARAGIALTLAFLGVLALLALVAWSLAILDRAIAPRRAAVLIFALVALGIGATHWGENARTLVAFAALDDAAEQATRLYRATAVMAGLDHRYDAELQRPAPAAGNLRLLEGHDVLLIFVESYGTAVLDEPRYRDTIAPDLAQFAATTAAAGYGMVSSRLVSPTFGGGSALAHGTLATGLKLDPFLYRLVTSGTRNSLARYLRAAGHRTVAVMPGIKKAWPEGPFWGYEQSYYAADLDYHGPGFGWFDIPDQYTLARFAERELAPGHAPLFAELVLVSSHTPFYPVPPYVADWRDAGAFRSVADAEWQQIYRQRDWSHLDAPYLASLAYDFRTLGAFLERLPGDPLVIILGDHQPPGLVSGAKSPWTVPVHVLSRDPALLAPFARAGYVPGDDPPAGAFKGMESFLGEFLAGFSTEAGSG